MAEGSFGRSMRGMLWIIVVADYVEVFYGELYRDLCSVGGQTGDKFSMAEDKGV